MRGNYSLGLRSDFARTEATTSRLRRASSGLSGARRSLTAYTSHVAGFARWLASEAFEGGECVWNGENLEAYCLIAGFQGARTLLL